ncbi:hypothetical protein [Streptomyces sp. NPDC056632]
MGAAFLVPAALGRSLVGLLPCAAAMAALARGGRLAVRQPAEEESPSPPA